MHVSAATYGLLFAAIVFEVLATSFIAKSEGLTRLVPIAAAACFYLASVWLSAYVLKTIPLGILYAIWCGVGVVIAGVVGYFVNKQTLDLPAMAGMGLIMAGLVVIYLFSKSVVS